MFQHVESYKHLLAKNLLHEWLSANQIAPWSWRSPGIIRKELKFFERSHPYYFEHGQPEGRILFVPDITVFHQGAAHLLIEVVHTSEVSEEKIEAIKRFFHNQWVQVWEINAEEVLRQTHRPTQLRANLIWSN